MDAPEDKPTEYGSEMSKHFLMAEDYTNLNHGSYGTIPRQVQDTRRAFQDEAEARIDLFVKVKQARYIDVSRAAIAKYLNAPVDECVFVRNATNGVNTALRNLNFQRRDVILYFATIYDACEATIASLTETTPVSARRIEYTLPTTHDELLRRFHEAVSKCRSEGLCVKAALFETVVSMPGVRFPFERLVAACKADGIYSVLDGAHGVGLIPIDLSELQPDFFVSNGHKWLFCPRGCAVFYVPKRNQHLIRTTYPTCAAFLSRDKTVPKGSKSRFELLFEWIGTDDDTAYLCVPRALQFREQVCGGEARIMAYLEDLAFRGGNLVAKKLGTRCMSEAKDGEWDQPGTSLLRKCAFAMVQLPIRVVDGKTSLEILQDETYPVVGVDDVPAVVQFFQTQLYERHKTFMPSVAHNGWFWVRLSAQVYLADEDFEFAAKALVDVCEFFKQSELASDLLDRSKAYRELAREN